MLNSLFYLFICGNFKMVQNSMSKQSSIEIFHFNGQTKTNSEIVFIIFYRNTRKKNNKYNIKIVIFPIKKIQYENTNCFFFFFKLKNKRVF